MEHIFLPDPLKAKGELQERSAIGIFLTFMFSLDFIGICRF